MVWDFADFPGAFPVHVVDVEQDRRIVLRWQAADDSGDEAYETTVTMEFEELDDGRTLVTIARRASATRRPRRRRHTATVRGGRGCCAR